MEKVDQERIGENKSDKKIIISEFTKSLLLDNYIIKKLNLK